MFASQGNPVHDVAVPARTIRRGLSHDCTVFNPPEPGVAVPTIQRAAVEDRDVSLVVVEIERTRLDELQATATARGWLRSCRGLSECDRGCDEADAERSTTA